MEITLTDGRKATVIGQVTNKAVRIRFEDGRETLWPADKLPQPKEGEDTLKLVVIPAIDRLEEFVRDLTRINEVTDWSNKLGVNMNESECLLYTELKTQSEQEFKQKWGLT